MSAPARHGIFTSPGAYSTGGGRGWGGNGFGAGRGGGARGGLPTSRRFCHEVTAALCAPATAPAPLRCVRQGVSPPRPSRGIPAAETPRASTRVPHQGGGGILAPAPPPPHGSGRLAAARELQVFRGGRAGVGMGENSARCTGAIALSLDTPRGSPAAQFVSAQLFGREESRAGAPRQQLTTAFPLRRAAGADGVVVHGMGGTLRGCVVVPAGGRSPRPCTPPPAQRKPGGGAAPRQWDSPAL